MDILAKFLRLSREQVTNVCFAMRIGHKPWSHDDASVLYLNLSVFTLRCFLMGRMAKMEVSAALREAFSREFLVGEKIECTSAPCTVKCNAHTTFNMSTCASIPSPGSLPGASYVYRMFQMPQY